jgi:hypothetical protein
MTFPAEKNVYASEPVFVPHPDAKVRKKLVLLILIQVNLK